MTLYTTRLEARETIAEGTMAFHLRKPDGFEFKPGQAIDLILPRQQGAPDDPGTRHAFSIVSAPFQQELVIATRMRASAFKQALAALPTGTQLGIDGPFGTLRLHGNPARAGIFIAGGIGITPCVSMLRQAARDRLPQPLILLYSNRRPEDAAFLAELQQLEKENRNFRLIATMTGASDAGQRWGGATGPITGERIMQVAAELAAPVFYVVGPPGMVEAMRLLLNRAAIDDDDIRSEAFHGY